MSDPTKNRDGYELNDHDSSMKFKDYVRRDLDKDPLKKEICNKVDEFNKCECSRTKDKLRREIEKLDKVRRQRDVENLR